MPDKAGVKAKVQQIRGEELPELLLYADEAELVDVYFLSCSVAMLLSLSFLLLFLILLSLLLLLLLSLAVSFDACHAIRVQGAALHLLRMHYALSIRQAGRPAGRWSLHSLTHRHAHPFSRQPTLSVRPLSVRPSVRPSVCLFVGREQGNQQLTQEVSKGQSKELID